MITMRPMANEMISVTKPKIAAKINKILIAKVFPYSFLVYSRSMMELMPTNRPRVMSRTIWKLVEKHIDWQIATASVSSESPR